MTESTCPLVTWSADQVIWTWDSGLRDRIMCSVRQVVTSSGHMSGEDKPKNLKRLDMMCMKCYIHTLSKQNLMTFKDTRMARECTAKVWNMKK